jgi:hypothetical protein
MFMWPFFFLFWHDAIQLQPAHEGKAKYIPVTGCGGPYGCKISALHVGSLLHPRKVLGTRFC